MIHEIVIQQVNPDKRDEYIKVFGEILTKANYPGPTASDSSPASKTPAA